VCRLDDLPLQPACVRIDVQDPESEVLQRAIKTVVCSRPVIVCERNRHNEEAAKGFSLTSVASWVPVQFFSASGIDPENFRSDNVFIFRKVFRRASNVTRTAFTLC
jgi:hypothetical protein